MPRGNIYLDKSPMFKYNNEKGKRILGLKYKGIKEILRDTLEDFQSRNFLSEDLQSEKVLMMVWCTNKYATFIGSVQLLGDGPWDFLVEGFIGFSVFYYLLSTLYRKHNCDLKHDIDRKFVHIILQSPSLEGKQINKGWSFRNIEGRDQQLSYLESSPQIAEQY